VEAVSKDGLFSLSVAGPIPVLILEEFEPKKEGAKLPFQKTHSKRLYC
jgi:hypothetical protein